MTQPLVILDPAHGGRSSCFYDMDNGVHLPIQREEVRDFQSSEKRYLSQDEYLRWKRGDRQEEPRFYFERKGRQVTYGDPGARNPLAPNLFEKDLVLDVARTLARLLDRRYVVKSTRDRDGYVSRHSRIRYANRTFQKFERSTAFLSLHAHASEDLDQRGFYVVHRPGQDDMLAECLHRALARHLEELGCGPGLREVREERSPLLIHAKMPAVKLQIGYLSHAEDAERLMNRQLRDELARCLSEGLTTYFRHLDAGTRPREAAEPERSVSQGAETSSAKFGEAQA